MSIQNKPSILGCSLAAGTRWSAVLSVNGHSVLLQQELYMSQLDQLERKCHLEFYKQSFCCSRLWCWKEINVFPPNVVLCGRDKQLRQDIGAKFINVFSSFDTLGKITWNRWKKFKNWSQYFSFTSCLSFSQIFDSLNSWPGIYHAIILSEILQKYTSG